MMSRRKAFDTSLTSAPAAPKPKTPNTAPTQKNRAPSISASLPPTVTPPDPAVGSATVPTETTEEKEQEETAKEPEEGEEVVEDDGICFICAEPITFWSVGICGHRTCHVCAIRLRTFYKKTECTFCKTSTPSVLFSRSPSTPFPTEHHITPSPPAVIAAALARADKLEKGERWDRGLTLPGKLDMGGFPYTDEKLGVVFEDEEMMEATLLLLRFNCPYPDCAHMGTDWGSLERHTLSAHGLVLCSLCRRQLSRFAHEQVLYPPHLLALHDPSRLARGQRAPRPRGEKEIEMVKGWEAPHPMCEFCHEAFFGPDELFKHMRQSHEECFVCRQLGEKDVYFASYPMLEQHFSSDHFPCTQPSCLEKKFVVFPSDMDLRAHMMQEHGEQMSARDRAAARQISVDFASSSSGNNRSRRNNQNNQSQNSGRGFSLARDSGVQQQQISQPPPMAPAQAAQARRALQVDKQEEGRRRRAFDTGLTGGEGDRGGSGHVTPREDVDDVTADRHAILLSKVSMLVSDNVNKMNSFRSAVRQFKNNESGGKDLIDTVYNVLDRDVEATVGVMRDVAGLFEGPSEGEKGRGLLEALNGFRVEQRDQFPALATPSALGSNYAGITSGAILNAKRSTHTRRHGSQSVWDRVEAAASSQPVNRPPATMGLGGRKVPGAHAVSSFPTLGAGGSGSSRSNAVHSTPWSTGGAGPSSRAPPALTGPIIRSINYPTAHQQPKKAQPLNPTAFPSLAPSSSKGLSSEERKALFSKPTPRETSIQRIQGSGTSAPVGSAWGTGPGTRGVEEGINGLTVDGEGEANGVSGGGGGGEGGKKKGKGKQLLFAVSARP